MSDFLKKFKGIFIAEDTAAQSPSQATQPNTSTPAATPQPQTVSSTPIYVSSGKLNERFSEILLTALEKNNQEGFDYFEFRESLKNLSKMPLDERTRYQSAFAMAQTMGATPDKLKQSASHYIQVLRNELTKFEEAHAQQRNKLIGERQVEFENLEKVIQNKAEQIKQLTKDIEESTNRREVIQKEIEQSTVKIENTRTDFEATFQVVVSQMEADIQKMGEYLK
jgi:uncharacterized protein (DUF3084 family)